MINDSYGEILSMNGKEYLDGKATLQDIQDAFNNKMLCYESRLLIDLKHMLVEQETTNQKDGMFLTTNSLF